MLRAQWTLLLMTATSCLCDDSLRGALEAVQSKHRALTPTIYFSNPYILGDGQPEDIGYGYHKSEGSSGMGLFEPVALPSSDLGGHDYEDRNDIKALEKLMMDYLEEEDGPREYARYPTNKRSVFRERDDAEVPEAWQRLYESAEEADEEGGPIFVPSPFRERASSRGGLRGGGASSRDQDEDNDRYLSVLNAVWEKYKAEEDPEDTTEADVEDLLEYLGAKEAAKRQTPGGYDFLRSPLAWAKRDLHRKKTLLRDAAFDERYPYRSPQKRFPIAKRSPPAPSPASRRDKKNAQTDPKVARELNDIFASEDKARNASNATERGQKEQAPPGPASLRPLDVKKKSVDWSEYFGMDKRRKKAGYETPDAEWLLRRTLEAEDGRPKKRGGEDVDSKLRAMEDMIVDQAIKYTGAHEGAVDSEEAQAVKDRVMTQLAAAYSLEKMRRALGEFKSSIAAHKAAAPPSHSIPSPKQPQEQKPKRIAVKKEKVETPSKFDKKENFELSNIYQPEAESRASQANTDEPQDCPILQEIEGRCSQVGPALGDRSDIFLPLCVLHQVCYLCGSEVGGGTARGCDSTFLSEAQRVCLDEAVCHYTARRTLSALRRLKPDPANQCDIRAQPCLARFLSALR